jgi:hypothetical protein
LKDKKTKSKLRIFINIIFALIIGFLVVYPTILYGRYFLIK